MNYYKPGECVSRQMTPEEMEAENKKQENRRHRYPWRYKNKTVLADYKTYVSEQKFRSATGKRRNRK